MFIDTYYWIVFQLNQKKRKNCKKNEKKRKKKKNEKSNYHLSGLAT